MERLLSWLLEYSDIPFIICGDFNNLRTDTIEKEWNLEVLDKLLQMNDLLNDVRQKNIIHGEYQRKRIQMSLMDILLKIILLYQKVKI